jgi:hypothetical protein
MQLDEPTRRSIIAKPRPVKRSLQPACSLPENLEQMVPTKKLFWFLPQRSPIQKKNARSITKLPADAGGHWFPDDAWIHTETDYDELLGLSFLESDNE